MSNIKEKILDEFIKEFELVQKLRKLFKIIKKSRAHKIIVVGLILTIALVVSFPKLSKGIAMSAIEGIQERDSIGDCLDYSNNTADEVEDRNTERQDYDRKNLIEIGLNQTNRHCPYYTVGMQEPRPGTPLYKDTIIRLYYKYNAPKNLKVRLGKEHKNVSNIVAVLSNFQLVDAMLKLDFVIRNDTDNTVAIDPLKDENDIIKPYTYIDNYYNSNERYPITDCGYCNDSKVKGWEGPGKGLVIPPHKEAHMWVESKKKKIGKETWRFNVYINLGKPEVNFGQFDDIRVTDDKRYLPD